MERPIGPVLLLLGLLALPATAGASPPPARYDFGKGGMAKLIANAADHLTFRLRFTAAADVGNTPLVVEVKGTKPDMRTITGMQATLGMPAMPEMGTDSYTLSRDPLGQWVSAPLISMEGVWHVVLTVDRAAKPALSVPFDIDFEGEPGGG